MRAEVRAACARGVLPEHNPHEREGEEQRQRPRSTPAGRSQGVRARRAIPAPPEATPGVLRAIGAVGAVGLHRGARYLG